MMSAEIVTFDQEPDCVREFLALPWRLYRGDPRWIPPFESAAKTAVIGPGALAGTLVQRHYLARRGTNTVGRLTAFVNREATVEGAPLGSIGNFEFEDDVDAAKVTVAQACQWLGDWGCKAIWAPMNGSIWLSYRFMTAGYEDMPFYGEPYNKSYYPELLAACGFTPLKTWRSVFSSGDTIRSMAAKTKPRYDAVLRAGYRFRPLGRTTFRADFLALHRLISDSFSGFAGFHAISEACFLELYGSMRVLAIGELIQFLCNQEDEIIGYLCMLPEFPRAVRAMRGRENWFAKLKFLALRGRPTAYIALYLGLTATEQRRRSGAGGALAHVGCKLASRDQVTVVSALMAEGSLARSFTSGQSRTTHDYALYTKVL